MCSLDRAFVFVGMTKTSLNAVGYQMPHKRPKHCKQWAKGRAAVQRSGGWPSKVENRLMVKAAGAALEQSCLAHLRR